MADPKPTLEVLEGGAAAGEAATAERSAGQRNLLAWLLGLLLLLSLAGFVLEGRRASELAGQVSSLSEELAAARSELSAARAALEAHRSQMAEVRTSVADLEARLLALRALVDREPGPEAP